MGVSDAVVERSLGQTGLSVSPIAFGAFKVGRNTGTKYRSGYELPDDKEAAKLLNGLLDLGIQTIDTAPSYGSSEKMIGRMIAHRRHEFVLSTKVGETFESGRSTYDFSDDAVRRSIHASLRRLRTDVLDIAMIHSDGHDLRVLKETDVVATLCSLRESGTVRAIGLSGKTVEGARAALSWADLIMVEYHLRDRSHEAVMAQANNTGVGVLVKKGLASGHLSPHEAIPFIFRNRSVASLVVGTLSLAHLRENMCLAEATLSENRSG